MKKQTYISNDGRWRISPLSRWLKIRRAENITPRNGLYYYSLNAYGGRCSECIENPGAWCDYFVYNRKRYPLEKFITVFDSDRMEYPPTFTDSDGVPHSIDYVEIDTGREPLYIEIDDERERVRVYSVGNIMN